MDDDHIEKPVSDAEIQEIIDQGEAGVADLIAAYEPIESAYFNSLQPFAPVVTVAIDTTSR